VQETHKAFLGLSETFELKPLSLQRKPRGAVASQGTELEQSHVRFNTGGFVNNAGG
jgi:hypothetical protein